jgi:hypothetical protein
MTMAELEKAHRNSDAERKAASRAGAFRVRLLATLNEEAKAIKGDPGCQGRYCQEPRL